MDKGKHIKTQRRQNPQTLMSFIFLAWSVSYLYFKNRAVLVGIPDVFQHNVLETIWNILFFIITVKAVFRVFCLPLWFIIFADNQKLGQKLQWYNNTFSELIPQYKNLNIMRWSIVVALAVFLKLWEYIPTHFFKMWSLTFSELVTVTVKASPTVEFFNSSFFVFWRFFGVFAALIWFLSIVEGRGRIIARILLKWNKYRESQIWKKALPPSSWNPLNRSFNISIFTIFTDWQSVPQYKPTSYEKWYELEEKGLKTNTLVIAPTGGGKTSGIVIPLLEQALEWQAKNIQKKAAVSIYDPKAELTDQVKALAIKSGRADDLCILTFDGTDTINPIQLDNIWDGKTSWKVASWVVSAWQNFQGKSSHEPYWETQAYTLFRNLIILIYAYNGNKTTLYDLSKMMGRSIKGCFEGGKKEKIVSDFGEYVIPVYLTSLANDIERENFIMPLQMPTNKSSNIIPEIKIFTETLLQERVKKKYEDQYQDKKEFFNEVIESKTKTELNFTEDEWNQHYQKYALLFKAKKLEEQKIIPEHAKNTVKDAMEWVLFSWSNNNEENRGSIVSGPQPFLQQFETPELKRVLSPEAPTVQFEALIEDGKILIPSFSAIFSGQQLANAVVTLVKSRWQHAVLSLPHNQRIKLQIMDEAQRIVTFADGGLNTGDFDYMEISRSFGGISVMLTQSLSALKARAGSNAAQFEKLHGVVRNIICLGTNDLQTIDYLQKLAGQAIKTKVSKTVSESGQNPSMEMISEQYQGETSSLSISYTLAENQENRLTANDIQEAEAFTAFASLYDGHKSKIYCIALKPHFWKDKTDKWAFMNHHFFKNPEPEEESDNGCTPFEQKTA